MNLYEQLTKQVTYKEMTSSLHYKCLSTNVSSYMYIITLTCLMKRKSDEPNVDFFQTNISCYCW